MSFISLVQRTRFLFTAHVEISTCFLRKLSLFSLARNFYLKHLKLSWYFPPASRHDFDSYLEIYQVRNRILFYESTIYRVSFRSSASQDTPPKTNILNPKKKVWKMNLLFKGVIFRFQPLVFGGVDILSGLPRQSRWISNRSGSRVLHISGRIGPIVLGQKSPPQSTVIKHKQNKMIGPQSPPNTKIYQRHTQNTNLLYKSSHGPFFSQTFRIWWNSVSASGLQRQPYISITSEISVQKKHLNNFGKKKKKNIHLHNGMLV